MSIFVSKLVGENAITLADGQKIFEQIYPPLKSKKKVQLDFDGVKVFASPFFNGAVGQLLKDLDWNEVDQLLEFINLSDFGRKLADRVKENAKQYYTNPAIKAAVDKVVSNQADNT